MIRKILKLRNIGLLQDATANGAVDLAKVTAIYAENGRGKSTLTGVLRACQLGDVGRIIARKTIDGSLDPEVDLLLSSGGHVAFAANQWNTTIPEIVIFDSEFVDQNIYSGFEVRPDQRQSLLEFALGDQTVRLKQQIDQLTLDIDVQTRRRKQAETILKGFASPYTVPQFIALEPMNDAQLQIVALHKRVDATRNTQVLLARRNPEAIPLMHFAMSSIFTVLQKQIQNIEETAEEAIKSHFAKHPSLDFEDWTNRGQQYLDGTTCPFCGQSISGLELIKAYRFYFNKAYSDLKQEVIELESQIRKDLADSTIATVVASIATNTAQIEAWKDQLAIDPPTLNSDLLKAALKKVREQLLGLVSAKRRAPLEALGSPAEADAAYSAIEEINAVLGSYNSALNMALTQIDDFKKNLITGNIVTIEGEIQKLEAVKRRSLSEVTTAVDEYILSEKERARLDNEKISTRDQLDKLMAETLKQYQLSINKLLTTFGADFSIEQLKPSYLGGGEPRSEYGLCVRNKSVKLGSRADIAKEHSFATTLSEADKRTLAFAFFIARLNTDQKLAEKIVVLDDPVSSLDRNRRYQSICLITKLINECQQLIVLSHDPYFVRELNEKLGDCSPTPISTKNHALKRVQQGYSTFVQCDIEDICSSDYYRHHRLVADFVDGKSNANARDVARAVRPLLEGYYHRRFPGKIPRRLMFGQIISLAAQAQPTDPLAFLGPTLKEMRDVNDYAGQFHHDTNSGFETVPVVDGELLGFARRALTLIYQNG